MPAAFEKIANEIFSPVDAGGTPRRVSNSDVQIWGSTVERLFSASSAAGTWYATRALMNADLAHDAGTLGIVYADPNPALNGMYVKQGASGSGSWTQISNQLPTGAAVVAVTVTSGGPNALTASFNPNTQFSPGQAIYILRGIAADNTGPITVNGKPYRTNLGSDFAAGGIKAGGIYLFVDNGAEYRSLTDQDIAALVTQAEDAANRAEDAAAIALGATPNSFPSTRADMAAQATTVVNSYLIEPGFEDFFHLIDITSGIYDDLIAADTAGGEIVVSNDDPDLAYLRQRKYGEPFLLTEFGGDIHVAQAVAAERAKLFGNKMVTLVLNVEGTIPITKGIVRHPLVNMKGLGADRTVITCDAMVNGDFLDYYTGQVALGGYVVMDARPLPGQQMDAHYDELPAFSAIAVGDTYVDFSSAHGLKENDVIIFYDTTDYSWGRWTGSAWVGERAYYRRGCRRRVSGVNGNRVYFNKKFRYAITYSSTYRAHKQTMLYADTSGFTIDLTGNALATSYGIAVHCADGLGEKFRDLRVLSAGFVGIDFAQSLNVEAKYACASLKASKSGAAFPNTSVYPLVFTNSTDCKMTDGWALSSWHAADAGGADWMGAVINENCVYERMLLSGTGQTTTSAGTASVHGNADQCGYRNCHASSFRGGGVDCFYEGGSLGLMLTPNSPGQLIHMGEVLSGEYRVQDVKMRSDRNTAVDVGTDRHMLRFTSRVSAAGEIFVKLLNVDIEAPIETLPILIGPTAGAVFPVSLQVTGRIRTPMATTSGLVQMWGAEAVAMTASHLDISGVRDVPDGVPWGTSLAGSQGHMPFNEMRFPKQRGVWTTGASATASETAANITLPHAFPPNYVPTAKAFAQSAGKGVKAFADIFSISTTIVRPRIATGDGTNMTAAAVDVVWEVD